MFQLFLCTYFIFSQIFLLSFILSSLGSNPSVMSEDSHTWWIIYSVLQGLIGEVGFRGACFFYDNSFVVWIVDSISPEKFCACLCQMSKRYYWTRTSFYVIFQWNMMICVIQFISICASHLLKIQAWSFYFFLFFYYYYYYIFGCATRHAKSQFPDGGPNLCPLQWKYGVLTTGPPGNSWSFYFLRDFFFLLRPLVGIEKLVYFVWTSMCSFVKVLLLLWSSLPVSPLIWAQGLIGLQFPWGYQKPSPCLLIPSPFLFFLKNVFSFFFLIFYFIYLF